MLALLASTQAAFSAELLKTAVGVLENDYDLKCTSLSASEVHCIIAGEPMTGLDLSIKKKGKTETLKISDFNDSQTALMSRAFDKGLDRAFFGQKIADTLIETIDSEDEDLICEKLHDNFMGRNSDYVLNPWWQVVNKSNCFDSKGKALEISANLGSINRSFGFMKKFVVKKI